MEKRYQVFLSSTFKDLEQERKKVFDALMRLNCIPAGMELFPAGDEEQFEFIKKVIDDSDYYILIVGGRYGSLSTDGVSFTEKEYEYALQNKTPILTFLHKDPNRIIREHTETDPVLSEKLEAFRRKISHSRLVQMWENADELAFKVTTSVVTAFKTHPAIGWIRSDQINSGEQSKELLAFKKKNEELEKKIASISKDGPLSAKGLAKGDEPVDVLYRLNVGPKIGYVSFQLDWMTSQISWARLFSSVAPNMINECSDKQLDSELDEVFLLDFRDEIDAEVSKASKKADMALEIKELEIDAETLALVKVQFRALGYIQKSNRPKSIADRGTYWQLTEHGDQVMTEMLARKSKI